MTPAKLFITAVIFFISGIFLLFHTYSNVLPEMMKENGQQYATPVTDTVFMADSSSREKPVFLCSVYFRSGTMFLSRKEQRRLEASLTTVPESERYRFLIDGYADPTGSGMVDNDLIALNRSYSVFSYLQSNGIPKDNLLIRTFGSSRNGGTDIDSLRKVRISLIGGTVP
jgi:outer membrane protein OmpA-like peptidoglycan-associated protein